MPRHLIDTDRGPDFRLLPQMRRSQLYIVLSRTFPFPLHFVFLNRYSARIEIRHQPITILLNHLILLVEVPYLLTHSLVQFAKLKYIAGHRAATVLDLVCGKGIPLALAFFLLLHLVPYILELFAFAVLLLLFCKVD
jgi:hypothetical protein